MTVGDANTTAERLERGELIAFPTGAFPLPAADDLTFLRTRQLRRVTQQAIQFNPETARISGDRPTTAADAERFAAIMRRFSEGAAAWLARLLPEYAEAWRLDRASLRTEEEAVRSLRHNARNDLLHIDNYPTRPSAGRRILRLFVNINPTEPRVWVTSEKFAELLRHFQGAQRVPARTPREWCEPPQGLQRLLQRDWSGRPPYDSFMLKLQQFLRSNERFQEQAPKRIWAFPPGSAWLLLADGLAHAVLRGQYALELSFFVPQAALLFPELSPLGQLVEAGRGERSRRAA